MPTLKLQLAVDYADLPNDQITDIENHFIEMVQTLAKDDTDIVKILAQLDDRVVLDFTRPAQNAAAVVTGALI